MYGWVQPSSSARTDVATHTGERFVRFLLGTVLEVR